MAKRRARKNKLITQKNYEIWAKSSIPQDKGVKPTIDFSPVTSKPQQSRSRDFSPGLGKIKGVKRRPGVARAKRLATQAAKRRAAGSQMPIKKIKADLTSVTDSIIAKAKARREAAGGISATGGGIGGIDSFSKPTGKPKRRVAKKLTPSQKATSLAKRLAARREKGFKEGLSKGGTIWSPKKKPGKPKRRKK